MLEVTGFVTAGGRSSRMGRDKAWLEFGGHQLIERVIDALKPVTTSIHIIANDEEYRRLGLPVFEDENTGIGPLEAIRTALANSSTAWVALVGCDLPFVTAELFAHLIYIADSLFRTTPDSRLQTPDPPRAIVPLNAEGLTEPLCALYSTAALPAVSRLIADGGRKVSLLFERLPTCFVAFQELRALANAELFFTNVNTPEEYQAALEKLDGAGI